MRMSLFLGGCLLIVSAVNARSLNGAQISSSEATSPTYPETEKGFRSEMKAIVEAYKAGDEAKAQQLVEDLRLPDAQAFFETDFGQEQGLRLAERYGPMFDGFASEIEHTVKDVVRNPKSELVQKLRRSDLRIPQSMQDESTDLTPSHDQKLYFFESAIHMNGREVISWEDAYLYKSGRFVFIGFGGLPLWSWKEGKEGRGAPNGNFFIPPILIQKVDPKYPRDLSLLGLRAAVTVRIIIGKDGRVQRVEPPKDGDPELIQAAVEAVKQWRYRPATIGGSPSVSEVSVGVSFR